MAIEANNPIDQLRSTLRRRCLVAVATMAVVLFGSYLAMAWQIHQSKDDAHLINISGRQRMLSQRITLLASEALGAPDAADASDLAENISVAVGKMGAIHSELAARAAEPRSSETLRGLYFGEGGVDVRVRHFLAEAQGFLEDYRSGGVELARSGAHGDSLLGFARGGSLLPRLDTIVARYESEAEAKIARFERVMIALLAVGLFTLAAQALLIFRPMLERIVDSLTSLHRSNAELLEFSYRISHDLRAPVASALGMLQIADAARIDHDEVTLETTLARAANAMNKLVGTIEDITELTKSKLTEAKTEPVNLGELVDDAVDTLEGINTEAVIEVRRRVELPPTINAKRVLLKQCIENLLSNSYKYYDPETDAPVIEVEAYRNDAQCVVCVRDNGIGIPVDYRDRVFAMFQRFHPRVSFGTGLGLYLVMQNARAMGGTVSYSPLENGSEFTLTFPA